MKKILFTFLIIGFTGFSINAQNVFEFLRLDNSPRAAALAGSFVANNGDANVMFYNPAGIKTLENRPVSFSFLKHLEDINSASLVYSQEILDWGRFAAGVQYISFGNFIEADQVGNKLGEFGAGDFAFTLGYANELDKNFYYGVNVKFIYSSIADYSSTGLAADIGLQYHIPEERWSFGFSILNLGSQISSYVNTTEDLPLDVRFGFAKTLQNLPFTFFASLNKLNEKYNNFTDRFSQFTFGGEFKLSNTLRLRLGYDNEKRKELKVGSSAGLAGFNLGLGINISDYTFDYGFSSLGLIGALHRIGISTSF
ncbi:MAG: type IX secretion system protein PorQ [Melioribacteraceae bacterium]|jgi:long-subunit fatty acid transport protein|nr:type IX secretion system protein PorQ [Melioribacteraceae bacterium]